MENSAEKHVFLFLFLFFSFSKKWKIFPVTKCTVRSSGVKEKPKKRGKVKLKSICKTTPYKQAQGIRHQCNLLHQHNFYSCYDLTLLTLIRFVNMCL